MHASVNLICPKETCLGGPKNFGVFSILEALGPRLGKLAKSTTIFTLRGADAHQLIQPRNMLLTTSLGPASSHGTPYNAIFLGHIVYLLFRRTIPVLRIAPPG